MALCHAKAAELGITLREEDLDEVERQLQSAADASHGGDTGALLASRGFTEEFYRFSAEAALYEDAMFEHFFGEDGSLLPDEDAVAYAEENGYIRAKHILFKTTDDNREPLDEAAVAASRERAEAALAQLRSADPATLPEVFDEIMHTQSEDPGLSAYPEGYYFQEGQMVTEFYEAALALSPGELSDIVESASTGYHILLRLAPDPDGVVEYDSSTGVPVTLRSMAAHQLFFNMMMEWQEDTDFLYYDEFADMDLADLLR